MSALPDTEVRKLARYLDAEAEPRRRDHFKDLFSQAAKHLREQADTIDTLTTRVAVLEAALKPFADIGIGSDPDYQPMIRMDRDAIVRARAAIVGGAS